MSTEHIPSNRRASRRSIDAGGLPNTSLSSPRSGHRRTVSGADSVSTTSSASSKISEVFDEEMFDTTCPVSPLSPPCDTSIPLDKNATPKASPATRRLGKSSQSDLRLQREYSQDEESRLTSHGSDGTPLKIPRKRPSTRKSRLSITERPDPPLPGPFLNPTQAVTEAQRTVSAPVLPFKREQSLDADQVPVPGRYESQTHHDDAEVDWRSDEVLPSINTSQNEDDSEDGEPATETDVSVDLALSKFVPYNCKKGRPEVREVIDTCTVNEDILELIKSKPWTEGKIGRVYIAESEEYGREKLKIGKTKGAAGKRIRKLQSCGLKLKGVIQEQNNRFHRFSFVESVVHKELTNQRLRLKCLSCTAKNMKKSCHIEWFEVDRDKALRVVETWRNWILIQEPFDSYGMLTPFWKWRVERLERSADKVNWQAWTQPSGFDHYLFLIRAHFASNRKDIVFYTTSAVVTLLSFIGHGGKGAIWAVIFLLLL